MNAVGGSSNQRENDYNKLLLTMHTGTKRAMFNSSLREVGL